MINLVGDGTYGLVYLAYNQENKEKVQQFGAFCFMFFKLEFLLLFRHAARRWRSRR